MCHHDDRCGPSNGLYCVVDNAFRMLVESACRFVKNQQIDFAQEKPREHDSLPLSTRELDAAFSDYRIVSGWKGLNEVQYACFEASRIEGFLIRARIDEEQVVPYR